MADYRDTFTSEILVNEAQANDAMEKYRKKIEQVDAQIKALDKDSENYEKELKKLQRQKDNFQKSLDNVTVGVQNYQKALNSLDTRSLQNLYKLKKQINAEIKKLIPGTEEYIRLTKDYKKVEERINSITKATQSMSTKIAGWFAKYWQMFDTLTRTITGVSMKFRQAAEDAAKLDDVYADVMKTTGLLHEEVEGLDKALMQIDTRTSREQLLLLARDAGKLGIQGKENILGFVRAADQIQVALGEDLGEGAIRNLGKIADVLGYTQSMGIEKSLLSIASSINAVGQASTASEAYLVDFTQRLAGVAAQTGISAANIIGFASGLDQSAMKVEMASTAFQKFIMKLYEDPAKFAEYANLEVEKFTDLLKNDANQAIITVLKSLKDQDGFASLVPIFKDMGLDGARAVSVLAAMATNINAVTEAQELANKEFEKATSVTEEYTTKNNNLQAQLEKARKEFKNASIALGQSLNPIMLKSTKLTTHLIKALATYGKEMGAAAIAIAVVTLAIKRQALAQTGLNVVQKVGNTLRATANTIIWAARTAIFRLIGATEAATIAQQQLNAVMSASVIGVVALAIGGLTAAITHFVKKQREAAETTDYLAEAEKRANEEYAEQAGKVRALTSIVENNNIALGERKKALNELKSIIPGYHADLTEEGRLINSNKEAINEYCSSLRQRLRLEARKEQLLEIEKQIAALEDQKADAQERQYKALKESGGDTTEIREIHSFWRGQQFTYTDYGKARKDESDAQKQIDDLEKQAEKFGQRAAELSKKIVDDTRVVIEEEQNKSNAILTQAQFDYLEDRYDKLTKKEKAMVDAGYATLSAEDSKALKARYDKLMKADSKAAEQRYQEQVKLLEQAQRKAENDAMQLYLQGTLSFQAYEDHKREILKEYTQKRIDLATQENKDITALEQQQMNFDLEARKKKYDKLVEENQEAQRKEETELKKQLVSNQITQEQYDSRMLEIRVKYLQQRLQLAKENGQDETAILKAILDAQVESEMLALEQVEKLKKEAKTVKDNLRSPDKKRDDEKAEELKRLEELHKAKLLSEEEYAKASKAIEKKYSDEALKEKLANLSSYTQQANNILTEASNFVTALKEAESAKLEAQYQADLTAAGDNAEKREQIEAEYEQKKLDLQKKYADTEMVINIAKTIAAGALAAIQAFAQLGPVGGAVAAALIAVTTAAEVATIIAQRNAIKNTTISNAGSASSGSTGSTTQTGTRTITGYSEGGNTKHAASDSTVVGVVHANEWVAPAWMVRENPTVFADLEQYRRTLGRSRMKLGRGFAGGGFAEKTSGGIDTSISKQDYLNAIKEGAREGVKEGLQGEYINAIVQYGDILIAAKKHENFKKQTTR